jgi:hypothetical protein
MQLSDLTTLLSAAGLSLRGGFRPEAAGALPAFADGRAPATVLLVGNVGRQMWPVFSQSTEARDGAPHPLDRWTRRIVDGIAKPVGAVPLYPFGGPPYWPFQRWAQRAETVFPSPLGILMHPQYGLWHAYRAALLFADPIELPPRVDARSPCETCADRPCLSACPVNAFTKAGFDDRACTGHITAAVGRPCMDGGCLARNACPVAPELRYGPPQLQFHMAAFRRARQS